MSDLSSSVTRRPALLIGGAIVALAGGLAVTTYARRPQSSGTPKRTIVASSTPIRTIRARVTRETPESERLSGTIEARHIVTVSSEVAARVLDRPFERGDAVTAGSLLVRFDDRTALANLAGAKASYAQAVAARKQAEAEYARAVIETDAAVNSAQASVAQATAGEKKVRSYTRAQEMRQTEAALSQAETEENLDRIERERYTRLVAEGAVAQQTLDHAQATYDAAVARTRSAREALSLAQEGARQEDITQATAQVAAARASLVSAQARPARLAALREQIAALRAQEAQVAATVDSASVVLSRHRIVAPISGRVLETRIERGEMTSPGTPVAVLADVRQVRAVFAVPEMARPLIHVGTSLTLTTDALPGKNFPARVAVLGYDADAKARTFRIELSVPNSDGVLLPNMTARLTLPIGAAKRQVSIPVSAVATDEVTGDPFVAVVREGKAVRQKVTLGAPIADGNVLIRTGLVGGETLATDPARITLVP